MNASAAGVTPAARRQVVGELPGGSLQRPRVSGKWFDGKACVVSGKKLVERAHDALQQKYGWQMWLLDAGSTLFGRIGRRAYLELSLG